MHYVRESQCGSILIGLHEVSASWTTTTTTLCRGGSAPTAVDQSGEREEDLEEK